MSAKAIAGAAAVAASLGVASWLYLSSRSSSSPSPSSRSSSSPPPAPSSPAPAHSDAAHPAAPVLDDNSGAPIVPADRVRYVRFHEPCEYVARFIRREFARRALHVRLLPTASDPSGVLCTTTLGAYSDVKADLEWLPYERIDFQRVLTGDVFANCYVYRKSLIRKAHLAARVDRYRRRKPESLLARTTPLTVVVDVSEDPKELSWCLGEARDAMEARAGRTVWILKPSVSDRAEKVSMLSDYESLVQAVAGAPEVVQWVLQEYVANPLVVPALGNRKFHLRVYVVAVGNLRVYVHEDVLCLFATEAYEAPKPGKPSDFSSSMHITNTCANYAHPDFDEATQIALLEDLKAHLGDEPVGTLFERIKTLVHDVFDAARGEISGFMPVPNCFELFGLDFLVTDDLQPVLLEVNAVPDLKNTGERLEGVISSLISGIFCVAIDEFIGDPEHPQPQDDNRLHLVLEDKDNWGKPSMGYE